MHPTGEAAVQSGGGAVENLCLLRPGSYRGTALSHNPASSAAGWRDVFQD